LCCKPRRFSGEREDFRINRFATNDVETGNDVIEGFSRNPRDEPFVFADVSLFEILKRLALLNCATG
jgi:hypothetical protein